MVIKTQDQSRIFRRGARENLQSLQWHLTNRCTWRCKHCYADSYEGEELPLAELKRVFGEYIELLKKTGRRGRLNLTGGEPFMRADFLDFLEYISNYKKFIPRCTLLTNGALLTTSILKRIIKKAPIVTEIQISIEGDREINDSIRGKGTFEKILASASLVKLHGIPVHLAATVSKLNYPKIFELLDLLVTYDISLTLRRFVPIGKGKKEIAMMLSPLELRKFYKKAQELNQKYKLQNEPRRPMFDTNMCTGGIQYLDNSSGDYYSCGVKKKGILTVMPNGDVYPCRLFPHKIGDVKNQSLLEIYEDSYEKLIKTDQPDDKCESCDVYKKCRGGAGCISAAVIGNFFARDPQCWKNAKK